MAALLAILATSAPLAGQRPTVHHLFRADDPPGAIGHHQRTRDDRGCQPTPVQLILPPGVIAGVAHDGNFVEAQAEVSQYQLLCGFPYRFRLRQITGMEGLELYPSIELIDRTSPPLGYEHQFPIEIAIDEDDLRAAAGGALVIRVVALEDPQHPVLLADTVRERQEIFDVTASEDPLQVADELGRPLAIVRMGGVRPDASAPDPSFCFGFPPVSITLDACPSLAGDGPTQRQRSVAILHPGNPTCCPACDGPAWSPRRDEIVCDGGDDGPRARVRGSGISKGLAPTETAASFRTVAGEQGYATSNRVCLYAPRFFATRKTIAAAQQEVVAPMAGLDGLTPVVEPSQTVAVTRLVSSQPAHSRTGDKIRHAIQDAQAGLLVDNMNSPEEVDDQQLPYAAEGTQGSRVDVAVVEVRQAEAIQVAIPWTRIQAAEIVIDDELAFQQQSTRAANEGVVYESRGGARLQLCKSVACAGDAPDRVRFTIRFDNVGQEVLREIVIDDYLSARLELMTDSPRCSLPAVVGSDQDDTGARKLQWRLSEPLPVGAGGTIEFECRVR